MNKIQDKEQKHFDSLVEITGDVWWGNKAAAQSNRLQRRAELVKHELERFHDPLVLEIGCGTGAFSKHILHVLPSLRLVCCDISPKAVQLASDLLSEYRYAKFEVLNVCALSYHENSFDAVIGLSILHHLPIKKAMAECFRVLKPGGIIWFSEPNMLNPQAIIELHIPFIGRIAQKSEDETAFIRWSFSRTVEEIGFQNVSVTPFDFLHPLTPKPLIESVDKLGRFIERVPLLREISGSLQIRGHKPQ